MFGFRLQDMMQFCHSTKEESKSVGKAENHIQVVQMLFSGINFDLIFKFIIVAKLQIFGFLFS